MHGMNMFPSGSTLQIPLDACTNFASEAGNAQITLTWTDPKDKYATPEGETAQDPDQLVSVWEYTQIIRKTGSQPTGPHDGELVVSSSVRDQYATTGFVDNGLTNDTLYYYAAYAYNTDGVASEGAFTSATPMAGTPLAELAEGTLIKILENGAPVEFYLAKHNYEPNLNGQGRELVVRKDSPRDMSFSDYSYELTEIYRWFRGTYKNRFSQNVISLMGTTKFPYLRKVFISFGNYDIENDVLESSVSALSSIELGCTAIFNSSSYQQGSILSIAAALRHYDRQWSRTPMIRTDSPPTILQNGGYSLDSGDHPVLPAFTLPSTALVDQNLNLIETAVQTTALSAT